MDVPRTAAAPAVLVPTPTPDPTPTPRPTARPMAMPRAVTTPTGTATAMATIPPVLRPPPLFFLIGQLTVLGREEEQFRSIADRVCMAWQYPGVRVSTRLPEGVWMVTVWLAVSLTAPFAMTDIWLSAMYLKAQASGLAWPEATTKAVRLRAPTARAWGRVAQRLTYWRSQVLELPRFQSRLTFSAETVTRESRPWLSWRATVCRFRQRLDDGYYLYRRASSVLLQSSCRQTVPLRVTVANMSWQGVVLAATESATVRL